jgi:glycerol-3-phosphate dehydrogenase
MANPRSEVVKQRVDLLVVGGGINGAGIARDAAGRGLSVVLCEQDDLAAHTSSASTKLIHGGLRYMERLHVSLVRKALREREVVLASAPHISWPLQFVIPHDERMRSAWMIRVGLVLYDNLSRRRRLAASHGIDLTTHPTGRPLQERFRRGFVYSDGWVDDARLVVLNALDAAERGARVLTRTRCTSIVRRGASWHARLQGPGRSEREFECRAVVNATGAWAGAFLDANLPGTSAHALRLVKGSHIVVRKMYDHPYAYIFQNRDRRVIFAIPYETDYTLIGTTDLDYRGDPAHVEINAEECAYLCDGVNRYFRVSITPADVVWAYSGVRALLDDEERDPSAVTRDYTLEVDDDGAPCLTVFGGKITTFRRLAEEAVNELAPRLDCRGRPWTAGAVLPGGDLPDGSLQSFIKSLAMRYPWLPEFLRMRYAHAYGTRTDHLLCHAHRLSDLGEEVLPGLYAGEIEYLTRAEWAVTARDILWRRSKLGLHLPRDAAARLEAWLAARAAGDVAVAGLGGVRDAG